MPIVGAKPRPAVLIHWTDDAVAASLLGLFTDAKRIASLDQVDQSEWDVLIHDGGYLRAHPDERLFVLGFADDPPGHVGREGFPGGRLVQFVWKRPAEIFEVPVELPRPIAELVRAHLVPVVEARTGSQPCLEVSVTTGRGPVRDEEAYNEIRPFLKTRRGEVLAGSFRRAEADSQCWALPPELAANPVPWVRAAVEEWRELAPAQFPVPIEWKTDRRWRTSAENEVADELDALRAERDQIVAEFAAREEKFETVLGAAAAEADAGDRRLLTATGDSLVSVTAEALRALGFEVDEMDEQWNKGDLLEDLRIRDPDVESWEAIAEVKGYTGGARVTDLHNITGRFGRRYFRDKGRLPDASWYIVNHRVNDPPPIRGLLMPENPAEVEIFAGSEGLMVATTDLFELVQAVKDGRTPAPDARRQLREARGRFTLDS